MKHSKQILIFLTIILLIQNSVLILHVNSCKDIVAVNEATDGDYNLLLKVRDPSRPGPQVLCIVPKGYTYTYHHPWTGKPIDYTTQQKYIGVATKDDIIPNIVKAGMALSEAGIAYGDADTNSNWKNQGVVYNHLQTDYIHKDFQKGYRVVDNRKDNRGAVHYYVW